MKRFWWISIPLAISLTLLFLNLLSPDSASETRVWTGIRLNDNCQSHQWLYRLEELPNAGLAGIMIELVVDPQDPGPAAGYRYYLPHPIDTFVRVLNKQQIPYGIHTILLPEKDTISDERLQDLLTDLSGLLLRSSPYPPQWLLFSGPWTDSAWHRGAFLTFTNSIRDSWEPFEGPVWFASPLRLTADSLSPPDDWVWQHTKWLSKKTVAALRTELITSDTLMQPMVRVLSQGPAWAGMAGRVRPWIKPGKRTAPIADLFLSGNPCQFPFEDREMRKVEGMLIR